MVCYFFIEELCGILFILCLTQNFQCFLLMVKGAFAPFHFWVSVVISDCIHYSLSWFMTIQKLPYYLFLLQLSSSELVLLVVGGSVLPLVQCMCVYRNTIRVFLLLSSRGNNLVLILIYEDLYFIYLVFYMLILNTVISSIRFYKNILVSFDFMFLLAGFPGSLGFYVKLYSVFLISDGGILILLFLCRMVLNTFCVLTMVITHNFGFSCGPNKVFGCLFMVFRVFILL